jgi:hypothetical protein
MWAVHYFDRRANRAGMSRSHASSAGALRNACDLMRQNCRVDHITGPDNQRIEASAIESWCRRTEIDNAQSVSWPTLNGPLFESLYGPFCS